MSILNSDARASHTLTPNAAQADQRLTVDDTAGGVQFAAFHADTTQVFWPFVAVGAEPSKVTRA